ncbi:MAG: hypothetical protein U0359_32115 [Byssovorax sp.]
MARSSSPSLPALLSLGGMLVAGACASACTSGGADPFPPLPERPSIPEGKPPRRSPPKDPVGGFSIEVPKVHLKPGGEISPCYVFPLEVTGPSRLVGGGSLTVGPGMHHGNITTRPKTGEGIRPCPPDDSGLAGEAIDIVKGGAVLFGSSTQLTGTEWQSFPEGMAYRIRDGYEIVARMHYLNVTSETLEIAPKYTWYTIAEEALTEELGPFAWNYNDIHIPPNTKMTDTGVCDLPAPMHIVNVLPHMHKLGTGFQARFLGGPLDGELFLDSPGYDPEKGVMEQYDPAVDLSQGDGMSFSCTWNNTLDKEIELGIGDNEMCILFGYAYPAENAFTTVADEGHCVWVAPSTP